MPKPDEWVEVGSAEWRALLKRKPRWQRWAGIAAVVLSVGYAVYTEHQSRRQRASTMVWRAQVIALTELAAERAGNARE